MTARDQRRGVRLRSAVAWRPLPGALHRPQRQAVHRRHLRTAQTGGARLERVRVQIEDGVWIPPDAVLDEVVTFGDVRRDMARAAQVEAADATASTGPSSIETSCRPSRTSLWTTSARRWCGHGTRALPPAKPTRRAHAYSLLRTVLQTAVDDDAITANPCVIRKAGSSKRKREIRPASLERACRDRGGHARQVPSRGVDLRLVRPQVRRACGATRRDVGPQADVPAHASAPSRARSGGRSWWDTQEQTAGVRDVAIPPHLNEMLTEHLRAARRSRTGGYCSRRLAQGSHLAPSSAL